MYKVNCTIEGIAPFLFNKMPTVDLPTNPTEKDRKKQAEDRAYKDPGGIYLPGWNIKRLIADGASMANLKTSKKPLWKLILATCFIQAEPRFNRKTWDYMDERMGRIPPRKGPMVMLWRPALSPGWQLSFIINVVDEIMPPELLKVSLETAGLLVGLGAFRPDHGRFIVPVFEVETVEIRGAKSKSKTVALSA